MPDEKFTKFVSVIFPTLDRDEILLDSLLDVLKQDYPAYEIIVVDQTKSPKREVLEFVQKNQQKINYIHLMQKGSPNARNVAAKAAKGEILIFLDDDIRINQIDFIAKHVRNYQDERVGLVGGRVVETSGRQRGNQDEVGKLKFWGLKKITHFDSKRRQEIDHAPGGNLSVRKEIYFAVDGFKTIYGGNAHLEETDFSLQVKRAGHKLIFEPEASLIHLHFNSGGNRVADIYTLRYWIARNYIVFALENYGRAVATLLAVRELCWAVLSTIKRREIKMFKVMSRGVLDGYRQNRKAAK